RSATVLARVLPGAIDHDCSILAANWRKCCLVVRIQPLAKGPIGTVDLPSAVHFLDQCHYMCQERAKPLTSDQLRAARALLRGSVEDLSRRSSVSLRTIRRAEVAEQCTTMTTPNNSAIRRALEDAGVEFIDENGGGPGVRLRKRKQLKKPT